MSLNTTPATFASAEVVTAAKLNTECRDGFVGIQAAWTDWTPTLTGFTLGNGTILARYLRVGKTIHYRIKFTAGSTSTFSSAFLISLPVAQKADYGIDDACGVAALYDASAGSASRAGATACMDGAGNIFLLSDKTATSSVADTVPWTWAVSDKISVHGTYEAA